MNRIKSVVFPILIFAMFGFCGDASAGDWRAIAAFRTYLNGTPPESEFLTVGAHHFTVVHNSQANEVYPTDPAAKPGFYAEVDAYLAACADHNLKVIFSLALIKSKGGDAAVQEFVDHVKNHSAVLGYITYDEPAWQGIPASMQRSFYSLVKTADPAHTIFSPTPIGLCDVEPTAYFCTTHMTDFVNGCDALGCAFDVLLITNYPFVPGRFLKTQKTAAANWINAKFSGFINTYSPTYEIYPLLEAFYQSDWPLGYRPYNTIQSQWDAWESAFSAKNKCIDQFGFFIWRTTYCWGCLNSKGFGCCNTTTDDNILHTEVNQFIDNIYQQLPLCN